MKRIPKEIVKEVVNTYKNTCYGYKRVADYIKEVYNYDICKSSVRNICIKFNIKKNIYHKSRNPTKEEIELTKRIKELENQLEILKIELDSYKEVYGE